MPVNSHCLSFYFKVEDRPTNVKLKMNYNLLVSQKIELSINKYSHQREVLNFLITAGTHDNLNNKFLLVILVDQEVLHLLCHPLAPK